MGRSQSGASQGRQSTSGYGKGVKGSGNGQSIPMQVQNHPALKAGVNE